MLYPSLFNANCLLARLQSSDLQRLQTRLRKVNLRKDQVLYEPGDAVRYSYFLLSGIALMLSGSSDGYTVEVGMVGNEGMVGLPVVEVSRRMNYRVTVLEAGEALKIEASVISEEFDRHASVRHALGCFICITFTQIHQAAVCNRFHTVEERLCRWLLAARDRARSKTICLTHDELSNMVGGPRTGITDAIKKLGTKGLLQNGRGQITILDRPGLESAACECYRTVNEQAHRLLAS
jgi:CRP-like cAMP-binding protein